MLFFFFFLGFLDVNFFFFTLFFFSDHYFSFFYFLIKLQWFFFFPVGCLPFLFFLFLIVSKGIWLNLYKVIFLSFHFSSQPNKKKFHPSTFQPPNQTQIRKTKISSILPLFYPFKQTNPKSEYGNWYYQRLMIKLKP